MSLAAATLLLFVSNQVNAQAGDLSNLVGTWSITGSKKDNILCPKQDATLAYQWVLTVEADGTATASVLGKTFFPSLAGKVVGDRLTLTGESGDRTALSGFDLRIGPDFASLTGERATVGNKEYCTWSVKGKKL